MTRGDVAWTDAATGADRPWDRAGARGLVGRHARAPRHPAAVRRGDPAGRVGAHVVQPRPRRGGGAGGLRARRRPARRSRSGRSCSRRRRLPCGLAPSFGVLVGARCVQALGGALLVCAALDLLTEVVGSDARAVRTWASAGVAGAALGPAVGGSSPRRSAGSRSSSSRRRSRSSRCSGAGAPRVRPLVEPAGTTEPAGEPRAPARLGRADGGAVPARAAARRRLAIPPAAPGSS